ncbi:hypothetical protein [Pontibacillus sp. HMF3514]|uniref:hypothetical protein n=1 Tax=Pontibacillus sp. HMF3514 TaxID=2692425 RepID=UPI00131F59A2|nr:hypothetical protein [Pontibacillus sp. HMF3514]QHE52298.1 hypothetical protein GS400_09745 [Pontibacillus sp. HMF3514]
MLSYQQREMIVEYVFDQFMITYPELSVMYDEERLAHIKKDTYHHLDHLESAISAGMKSIYFDYIQWTDRVLTSRGIGTELLVDCLKWMEKGITLEKDIENLYQYQSMLKESISYLKERTTG